MNDKELLELAAKASGIKLTWWNQVPKNTTGADPRMNIYAFPIWNPLTDDGDALRLAVKLGMGLDLPTQTSVYVVVNNDQLEYCKNKDHYAATRRAIVRAAAEIGRTL